MGRQAAAAQPAVAHSQAGRQAGAHAREHLARASLLLGLPAVQMSGGQKYRPPREDPNAPDLYLPVMAAWTYVLLACVMAAGQGKFTPEVLSTRVSPSAAACASAPPMLC